MSLRSFSSCRLSLLLVLVLCASAPARAAPPTVLVLGDSLSAGYGLDADQGWVRLLKQKLAAQGFDHQVVNASVSGETTAGGLARLPSLLDRHRPQLVLVELGGNDGLRALPLTQMRSNLEGIVDASAQAGATAVLFEMRIPSNYGPTYTEAFTGTFAEVADDRQVPLVPFLLSAFAEDPDAFLSDGIHPSASAQPLILDTVWPHIEPLLRP